MSYKPSTGDTNIWQAITRASRVTWFGADSGQGNPPPLALNNEWVTIPNAAGTAAVNVLKVDASNNVVLGSVAPLLGGALDFSTLVPGTETTGSVMTTQSTWVAFPTANARGMKLLLSYTCATGEFNTLCMRARSNSVAPVVCGNFSASGGQNDYGNLYAVQGYAQPSAVGATVYTQGSASNYVCGVYSCIDRQATATSAGYSWSTWIDSHIGAKASGSDYLLRMSHNGTVASDGAITIFGGGRLPVLLNIEDSAPGFLGTSGADASGFYGRIAIKISTGALKYINLYSTSNA